MIQVQQVFLDAAIGASELCVQCVLVLQPLAAGDKPRGPTHTLNPLSTAELPEQAL